MSTPDCGCGHPCAVHYEPDDEDGNGAGCGEPGCPCEGYIVPYVEPETPPLAPVRRLERAPDPGTIRMLEDLLAEARDGKIVGLVAVTADRDAFCRTWQTGHYKSQDILWSLEVWKTRQIQRESE